MSTPPPPDTPPPSRSGRPPEMVAATQRPVQLAGRPASVVLTVPSSAESLVPGAKDAPEAGKIYLQVEDIEAARNPGVVYGVFLDLPADRADADLARHHIGNIALFGIEVMNDPDQVHEGAPGFRHTFDVTTLVTELRGSGDWDPGRITVTFEPILPESAPGREADASSSLEQLTIAAEAIPVRVGRVSLFVA